MKECRLSITLNHSEAVLLYKISIEVCENMLKKQNNLSTVKPYKRNIIIVNNIINKLTAELSQL